MHDSDRYLLINGPYQAPRRRIGGRLFCELRGEVIVHGMSAGRIAWPRTKVGRSWAFILCGDLSRAVAFESNQAVCYWWGVTPQTVTKWRKALDVPEYNDGTRRLHSAWMPERIPPEVHARAIANANTPEANAKKAAAKIGKPRPPHVHQALRDANLGRKATKAARKKMSEAQRRRGAWPPAAGSPWEQWEDDLLGTMPVVEVAAKTGRTPQAVYSRMHNLGIKGVNRRKRKRRPPRRESTT